MEAPTNTELRTYENIKRCPRYGGCSKNLCALDENLSHRVGKNSDKCRFMLEPQTKNIQGKIFTSGGSVMPDVPLELVPESNIRELNTASQEAFQKLNNNT